MYPSFKVRKNCRSLPTAHRYTSRKTPPPRLSEARPQHEDHHLTYISNTPKNCEIVIFRLVFFTESSSTPDATPAVKRFAHISKEVYHSSVFSSYTCHKTFRMSSEANGIFLHLRATPPSHACFHGWFCTEQRLQVVIFTMLNARSLRRSCAAWTHTAREIFRLCL